MGNSKYNRNVEFFCCYRDRAKYIPGSVECSQLAESLEVVESALIAVELPIVFQHSDHAQTLTERPLPQRFSFGRGLLSRGGF